jgi:hypothetical protein
MKFIVLLTFSILCCTNFAWAQTSHFIDTKLGGGVVAFRDHTMSALMYSGANYSGAIAYTKQTINKTVFFQLNHHRADISNQFGNSCTFRGFALKNHNLYNLNIEHGGFAWGWSNNNYFNYYQNQGFGNFSERSNYFTTFGLVGQYSKHFTLFGRGFGFVVPVDVQLAGFYLRPSYVSSSPEGYLNPDNSGFSAWFNSIEAFLPHRTWNFGVSPGLSFSFKSGNAISISYQYEFFRISNPEPISQSAGVWFVGITTRL